MKPWSDEREALNGKAVKENFNDWFGNSRVVDRDGNPLIVYHGTRRDISQFRLKPRGWAANNVWGHFFTCSTGNASGYSNEALGSNVMPVYLSLQNPYIMTWQEWQHFNTHLHRDEAKALKKQILAAGHDGIIDNAGVEFVAFRADQIKSAVGNSGLYLKGSPCLTDREAALQLELARQAREAANVRLFEFAP